MRIPLLLVCLLVPWRAAAQDHSAKFDDQKIEFFENRVRPLLVEHCSECHGPQADPVQAGFHISSRQSVLAGGDSGPAIVPGNATDSLLIEAVNYRGAYEMPPDTKLTEEQIAVLTQWVQDGAAWPEHEDSLASVAEQFDLAGRKDGHWCWHPVERQQPPAVLDAGWPMDPIDNFVLAKLEGAGLSPATDTDRRTWLRRVWFDLVGLPPSPADVAKFLDDPSDDAFETVVDALLGSPHFGERWARHWMDLTRYAETHGHEFDYPIEHAWQYRDYLIRAFNADVPYDDFVREQIAGDLLPKPRFHATEKYNESIIGTGFWFLGEATHGPVDVKADEAGRVDNQIDVMAKTFLGLTVACARCHDHKVDAISTQDYYALSGFLQSSRRQIALLDPNGEIEETQHRVQQALIQLEVSSLNWDLRRNPDASAKQWRKQLSLKPITDDNSPSQLFGLAKIQDDEQFKLEFSQLAARQVDRRRQHQEFLDGSTLYEDFNSGIPDSWFVTGWAFESSRPLGFSLAGDPISAGGRASSGRLGGRFQGVLRSPTFEIEHEQILVRAKGDRTQIRLIIDGYHLDSFNPLLFAGCSIELTNADRFEWIKLDGDVKNYRGHRAYLEIIDHGDSFCEIDEIRFADANCPPPVDRPSMLVQAVVNSSPESRSEFNSVLGDQWRQWIALSMESGNDEASEVLSSLVDSDPRSRWTGIRNQMIESLAKVPEPMKVIAMADGTAEDEHLFIRGNSSTPGDIVPRRFLTALDNAAGKESGHHLIGGSGRLQLAEQIASDSNPLASRVMVNRIWQHLLGRGLVASSDNFGLLGQPPTHPQLLDFLASEFCADNWSVKRMIRRIVLSRTYRMSSQLDPAGEEADPENLLLHRARIKRLPGEAIRDSILKISGSLDTAVCGPSVPVYLTEFMQGRGRPATSGPLDGGGRRSIYTEVRRNFLSPMMLAFDTPIPFNTIGTRHVSNVPAQALTLMNDPFVIEQSHRWAERIMAHSDSSAERIDQIFQQAFCRLPSSEERATTEAFFRGQAIEYGIEESSLSDVRIWRDLCHVVLNMKEFIFLE